MQGVKQRSEAKITALEEQTKELQSAVETEKEKSKTVRAELEEKAKLVRHFK